MFCQSNEVYFKLTLKCFFSKNYPDNDKHKPVTSKQDRCFRKKEVELFKMNFNPARNRIFNFFIS